MIEASEAKGGHLPCRSRRARPRSQQLTGNLKHRRLPEIQRRGRDSTSRRRRVGADHRQGDVQSAIWIEEKRARAPARAAPAYVLPAPVVLRPGVYRSFAERDVDLEVDAGSVLFVRWDSARVRLPWRTTRFEAANDT
jgi:hypothetical protein